MRRFVIFGLLFLSQISFAADRWYEYQDCKHLAEEYYDGDSFHVKTKSDHFIFRLYFVDAPETDTSIPDRVKEQAEYWNITEERLLKVAAEAKEFTEKFLSNGFIVYSKRQTARGQSKKERFFAMVKVNDRYLCEALVENGYARVYGAWSDLPDGTNSRKFISHLKALEIKARRAGKGAWAGKRKK